MEVKCVAHLHGGNANGTTMPLARAYLQIPMPVWGEGIEDSTTELYQLRPRYLGGPVVHYDYVTPVVAIPPRLSCRRRFRSRVNRIRARLTD